MMPEWFIVAWWEDDAEKETVFSQEPGIFKGSDEHFTYLLYLTGLPLNIM